MGKKMKISDDELDMVVGGMGNVQTGGNVGGDVNITDNSSNNTTVVVDGDLTGGDKTTNT